MNVILICTIVLLIMLVRVLRCRSAWQQITRRARIQLTIISNLQYSRSEQQRWGQVRHQFLIYLVGEQAYPQQILLLLRTPRFFFFLRGWNWNKSSSVVRSHLAPLSSIYFLSALRILPSYFLSFFIFYFLCFVDSNNFFFG